MIKMGEIREIEVGKVRAWGYDIKSVWLCKRTDLNVYVLMGCTWDGERCHGWCTLKSDSSLKVVRSYAREILN